MQPSAPFSLGSHQRFAFNYNPWGKAGKFGSTSDQMIRIKKVAANGLIESTAENDPWASGDNEESVQSISTFWFGGLSLALRDA